MDYGLLNAIAITIMAVFGLWAFQKGAVSKRHRSKGRKDFSNYGDLTGKRAGARR